MTLIFTIPLQPRTKKNSMQIIKIKGVPRLVQSKKYREYEKACGEFLNYDDYPIDYPVNVETRFYMKERRRVDISNLMSAAHDVLVHYNILADDNRNIIYSVDGSRVFYDKENPRTEIVITDVKDFESWR